MEIHMASNGEFNYRISIFMSQHFSFHLFSMTTKFQEGIKANFNNTGRNTCPMDWTCNL